MKFFKDSRFKLALLFIVAFIPRIIGISSHSLFPDEITWMVRSKEVYANVRSGAWENFERGWWLNKGDTEAIGLPLTFLGGISMAFLTPGYNRYSINVTDDFVAVRLPAVVIGSLYVPVLYFLLAKYINEKKAFFASLLLAIDPIYLALSRLNINDLFLMIFSSMGLLIYFYNKRYSTAVLSAFFTSLAIITKPQGFLIIITVAVVSIIIQIKKRKLEIKRILIYLLSVIFFTILLFPYLWHNPLAKMYSYVMSQIELVGSGHLTFFNGQITSNPPWYYYFAIFPFRIPEGVLFGLVVGLFTGVNSLKNKFAKDKILTFGLVYSVLFLLVISLSDKKLGIRYLFGIWPYIYLISVFGIFYLSEKIKDRLNPLFLSIIFSFSLFSLIKFYPSYGLFHNMLIKPEKFQLLESVALCDSVKPAIEYLETSLYHGVTMMYPGCDSEINYYTGFTIYRRHDVSSKPELIILDNHYNQKFPHVFNQIKEYGYKEVKNVDFRGLELAKIYQYPSFDLKTIEHNK